MYKAALIGLGNIAWKLGRDRNSGSSLSHKDAFDQHPQITLTGGYSPAHDEAHDFSAATGIRSYTDLTTMLQQEQPDLVSICSPTKNHAQQLQQCFEHGISMVWLEKPAACDAQQIRNLLAIGNTTTTLVNYQRRYTDSYQKLRQLISDKQYGQPLSVNINYSRGLETNGSHMLDMLFFITGESGYDILWVETGNELHNPDCVLRLDNDMIVHIHGLELDYHNIDISVTCTAGRLSILHGGMTLKIETRTEHELFPGFYRLQEVPAAPLGQAGFDHAFDRALADLLYAHEQQRAPLSNLETALLSESLLQDLLQRSRQ